MSGNTDHVLEAMWENRCNGFMSAVVCNDCGGPVAGACPCAYARFNPTPAEREAFLTKREAEQDPCLVTWSFLNVTVGVILGYAVTHMCLKYLGY